MTVTISHLIMFRHPPNFVKRKVKKIGKCRNYRKDCEDCMTTNVSLIYSVHYTQCKYCSVFPTCKRHTRECWHVEAHSNQCSSSHVLSSLGRKPWNCIGTGAEGGRIPGGKPGTAIDTNAGNFGEFINDDLVVLYRKQPHAYQSY